VRRNTKEVFTRLRELGVKRIAIFTGDRMSVAKRVGRLVGADQSRPSACPKRSTSRSCRW
jgi:cation transport ATPase